MALLGIAGIEIFRAERAPMIAGPDDIKVQVISIELKFLLDFPCYCLAGSGVTFGEHGHHGGDVRYRCLATARREVEPGSARCVGTAVVRTEFVGC